MYKDIIGKRFGRLTVIKFSHRDKSKKHIFWLCKCNCGNKTVVLLDNLRKTGHTRSCGCLRKECIIKRQTKHGMTESIEYKTLERIKTRCFNKYNRKFKDYGGRGITVCKRWLKFENFYKDMGKRPSENHSIDRIDNDKNYCKENCRWATMKQQQRNKRNNRIISYKGKTKCLAEWVEELNIEYQTLLRRLDKGWSIERAFTQKVKYRIKKQRNI